MLGKLAALVLATASLLGFGTQKLGTAVPSTPALIDTYLASSITKTDTSMTLASGVDRAGTSLSGYYCFVLDVNQPTVEYVCGTASGTSVTALSRGIDPSNPNTTSSDLAYGHRRSASVQITDYPTIQFLVRRSNGLDSFDSPLSYSTGTPAFITSSTQIASKGYVDSVTTSGAPPADTTTAGLSVLATQSQTAQGTATTTYNSQTYTLVPQNRYFSTTSTATNVVPVTGSGGKLSQGFLDLAQGFSFTGGVTSTATTTISGPFTTTGSTTLATTTLSGTVYNGFANIGGDYLIYTTTTDVTIVNASTTPNQVLFSFTIPTSTVIRSNVLHVKARIDTSTTSGTNLKWRLRIGSTDVATSTYLVATTTPIDGSGWLETTIFAIGSSTLQETNFEQFITPANGKVIVVSAPTTALFPIGWVNSSSTTTTINMDQSNTITAYFSSAPGSANGDNPSIVVKNVEAWVRSLGN